MLIGEYQHRIDAKRRLALPSKFRKELGKQVVVTRGLDSCLFVYTQKQWGEVLSRLSQLSMGQSDSRAFARFFLSGATDVELDSLGRILLPEHLADFAGLGTKAIVVGVHERVEVWSEKRWKTYTNRVEKQADMVAEKLGDLGVL